MNIRSGLVAVTVLAITAPGFAEPSDSARQHSGLADMQWYASISASHLWTDGNVKFYGTTARAYGGMPTIGMEDGDAVSFAIGFADRAGWRLEGSATRLTMRTDSSVVPGLDDRTDDLFSVAAEVDSWVFMLNGSYDLNIGSPRFTPYLKAGVGVAYNTSGRALLDLEYNSAIWDGSSLEGQSLVNHKYPEGKATEFAWNLDVGIRLHMSQRFDSFLQYGFLSLGNAQTELDEYGDVLGFNNLTNRQLSIGLEYRF
jgi:opacity protein-like surface antigen